MKESKLIFQLKKKNLSALERCIDLYTPYVSTIIRNALRGYVSHEDLEELTADVFVSLWNSAEQIRSEHLSGYLAAIAKSKACNYMRRNIVLAENLDEVVIASDENVEEEAEQQVLAALLKTLLQELPDKEREIMIRYYYYQQTVSEVAQSMDMNVSTVKTKLSRSRKKLKQMLIERGYGYEEMELI
ncbi:MAG: sigma-70 family RNA polymerase sigma factor [Ruminococcus sp.]|nr:sigma-70 family RNA polymerase sigma factor [Ruminococcus sp.]